jgi:ribonuclease E
LPKAAALAAEELHDAPPAFVAEAGVDANERIEALHGEPSSNLLNEEKQGRRRRRRRGPRAEGEGDIELDGAAATAAADAPAEAPGAALVEDMASDEEQAEGHVPEEAARRRRRRGGRRDRDESQVAAEGSEAVPDGSAAGAEADDAVAMPAPQQLELTPPAAEQPIVVSGDLPPEAPAPQPVATRYELPASELQQLAAGSGLTWVHSDADKVAAAQAAMAAQAKPVHTPRERPAQVQLDEGPLVLVETRKDLSQVKLPFDA